jgi:hypothetical protein
MSTNEQRAKLEGKVEMIDIVLNSYCDRELTPAAKQHLKNVRFGLVVKIEKLKK